MCWSKCVCVCCVSECLFACSSLAFYVSRALSFPVHSSFANLYYGCVWISSMLTWWKVSSICYTVLFGFTISILHFICPLFFLVFFFCSCSLCVVWFRFLFLRFFLFPFDMYEHGFPSHHIHRLAVRATSFCTHDGGDEEWKKKLVVKSYGQINDSKR